MRFGPIKPLADSPWGSWRRRVGSQFTLVRDDFPCGPSSFQQPSASLLLQLGLIHSFACSLLFPGKSSPIPLPAFWAWRTPAHAAPCVLGLSSPKLSLLLPEPWVLAHQWNHVYCVEIIVVTSGALLFDTANCCSRRSLHKCLLSEGAAVAFSFHDLEHTTSVEIGGVQISSSRITETLHPS